MPGQQIAVSEAGLRRALVVAGVSEKVEIEDVEGALDARGGDLGQNRVVDQVIVGGGIELVADARQGNFAVGTDGQDGLPRGDEEGGVLVRVVPEQVRFVADLPDFDPVVLFHQIADGLQKNVHVVRQRFLDRLDGGDNREAVLAEERQLNGFLDKSSIGIEEAQPRPGSPHLHGQLGRVAAVVFFRIEAHAGQKSLRCAGGKFVDRLHRKQAKGRGFGGGG